MREIEKVSISGISFMLEHDAYEALDQYLARLRAAYASNPDSGEIIADIEARVAEIILTKQEPGSVVSLATVQDVIDRLGLPEEAPAEAPVNPEKTFPRRLYRNMDGAKLGGVCNGLGTFFDVDPVWVRLVLFAPLILLIITAPAGWGGLSAMLGTTVGVVPLIYLVLWFVVPSARTPRQKLEMRGERITASSIENNFRESAPRNANAQRSASVWAEIIYVIGRIALLGIKAVAMVMALGLVVAAVVMVVVIGAAIFAADKMMLSHMTLAECLPALSGIAPEWYVAVTLLVALLPVVMLALLLFGLIFDRRVGGKMLSVLGGIWLIITVYWGIVTIRNVQQITDRARTLTEAKHESVCRVPAAPVCTPEECECPQDSLNNCKPCNQSCHGNHQ